MVVDKAPFVILPLCDIPLRTIILTAYIDHVVVTKENHLGIIQLKTYLSSHFHMKGLRLLGAFGMREFTWDRGWSVSKESSQIKHLIDLLEETHVMI